MRIFMTLLSCVLLLVSNVQAAKRPDATVIMTELQEGYWQVEFQFRKKQRILAFLDIPPSELWTSHTQGAEFKTFKSVEAIVFKDPSRSAVFTISAKEAGTRYAASPFMAFADGGVGLLTRQFQMSPLNHVNELLTFQGVDFYGDWLDEQVIIRSSRPLFYKGEWHEGEVVIPPEEAVRYLYVGNAPLVVGDSFDGLVDAGLPQILKDNIDADLKATFAILDAEWGFSLPRKAEVLFSLGPQDREKMSMSGAVMGNQISLTVSGKDVFIKKDEVREDFVELLAHEAVHLYQVAAGKPGSSPNHAWMHEGSADAMAHRVAARLSETPKVYLNKVYQEVFKRCTDYLEQGESLYNARRQNRYNVYYPCGDLMLLLMEAEFTKGDMFDFWRVLLATQMRSDKERLEPNTYFAVADYMGVSDETLSWLNAFVYEPTPNPKAHLFAALERAGYAPVMDQEGVLTSLSVPY